MRKQSQWLVCSRPRTTPRLRLVCFPHAGGGASAFSRWGDMLKDEIEVWAVQMPGREVRLGERPLSRMQDAVAAIVEEISRCVAPPFALFGHSLGALTAFEVARDLRRRRLPEPCHLFASGARAPHLPDPDPPIHHLPDEEFLEQLCERYEGVPQDVLDDEELLQIVMVPLRADFEISETYRYETEPPLACSLTALGGEDDLVRREELEGWREQTQSGFQTAMYPGGHFFVQSHQQQVLQLVADTISKNLHVAK